ncbi:MAG: hypothetical protein ACRCUF_04705 [Aeromonas sobria]
MKRFTVQDIATVITLIVLAVFLLAIAVPAQASEKVNLWGPAPATQEATPAEPTTSKQGEAEARTLNPKSLVDTVEGVIQKGEALEQQGRRFKRLIDR